MKFPIFSPVLTLLGLTLFGCTTTDSPTVLGPTIQDKALPIHQQSQAIWKTGIRVNEDGTKTEIQYQEIGEYAVTDGDIIIAKLSEINQPTGKGLAKVAGSGILPGTNNARRWSGNKIPYVIDPAVTYTWEISLAVAWFNRYFPIKYVARTTEADYVTFTQPGHSCSSYIGRVGGGSQPITVGDWCRDPFSVVSGGIMHEMGHAAGLPHEQTRWDRDSYVIVDPSVSGINYDPNPVSGTGATFSYYSTPYDFASMMQYASWGQGWDQPWVIQKVSGGIVQNNLFRPSFFDVRTIANMYGTTQKYRYRQSKLRDYTGDGIADMVYISPSGLISVLKITGTSPSNTTGTNLGLWLSGFGNSDGEYQSGDFNGDGKADLMYINSSNNTLQFATSNGSSFTVQSGMTVSSFGTANGGGQYRVGDFNGDGKDDIAYIDPTNNSVQVALSNGTSFPTRTTWLGSGAFGSLSKGGRYSVGKFNADNLADLVSYSPLTGLYTVALSTGTSFTTSGFSSLGWITGVDGPADLLIANYASESGSPRDELLVADPHCKVNSYMVGPPADCVYGMGNNSSSFGGEITAIPAGGLGGTMGHYYTGRLNSADALEDIIYVQPGGNSINALFSTGTGFGNYKLLNSNFGDLNGLYL